jgi:uncharacterized damage-inducible protein DinB
MEIAFQHHAWATRVQLKTAASLTQEQLSFSPPGVYGGILDTLRHLVGADRWYLQSFDGQPNDVWSHRPESLVEEDTALNDVVKVADENATLWMKLLPQLDLLQQLASPRLEGGTRSARIDVRLAQALYHGNDHRSQVNTTLTLLGLDVPAMSVWNFGVSAGLVSLD